MTLTIEQLAQEDRLREAQRQHAKRYRAAKKGH
jgi:hypothetical protein